MALYANKNGRHRVRGRVRRGRPISQTEGSSFGTTSPKFALLIPFRRLVLLAATLMSVVVAGLTLELTTIPAGAATFSTFATVGNGPAGEAFDASSNLFVANFQDNTISEVTPAGVVTTFATGLSGPAGLAFEGANLYVSELGGTILKITPADVVTTFATGFHVPRGEAFDAAGNLYVVSTGDNTVSKVTPAGVVSTFASGFSSPERDAFDTAGNLYVSNSANNTVSKVTPGGVVSTFASGFAFPAGLAFDAAGNLYVGNFSGNTVSAVTPAGVVTTFASGFNSPEAVAFDSVGRLYVGNNGSDTIFVDQATPTLVTQASATVSFGNSITDTATLSGGASPTGTISFDLYGPNATPLCTGSNKDTPTPLTTTVNAGNGTYTSPSFTPASPGTYYWIASYSGDANNAAFTGSCGDTNESVVLSHATASVTTTVFDATTNSAWAGTEVTGATAYDTSTVTGLPSAQPTGTVTYTFYATSTCDPTSVAAPPSTKTIQVSGAVPNSDTTVPLGAFNYGFEAVYSGDSNYAPAAGACEPFSVGTSTATATVATTVFDATSNTAWSGNEVTGATAYDTATVTGSGPTPTGSVTYTFYATNTCDPASVVQTSSETLAAGHVPNSATTVHLGAFNYAFEAVYSGDTNYASATGTCEPFSVGKGTSAISTTVDDAATSTAWTNNEVTGASAFDTSTVTGVPTIPPTGTVVYSLYPNGACSGTATVSQPQTLVAGNVPNSGATGALSAGSYSIGAVYSGDTNYTGVTASCEPFTVNKATPGATTVVDDAATTAPWTGLEMAGAHAFDTATVTAVPGFTPTGTVLYTIYSNNGCTGSAVGMSTQTLAGGVVPQSTTMGGTNGLAAGPYGFKAVYSGDANYLTQTATCEPFNVLKASPTISTVASQSIPVGNPVNDVATLAGGYLPTGTVSFALYGPDAAAPATPLCTQQPITVVSGTVGLVGGVYKATSATYTPPLAGTYYWIATYNGDANNNTAAGHCGDTTESVVVTAGLQPTNPQLSAAVCQAYSQVFSAGPGYTYTISSPIPPGLSFNGTTGTLSGLPTTAGGYTFTITATGPGLIPQHRIYVLTVALCINGGHPPLTGGTHGRAYSVAITTTGGTAPYRYQMQGGALPPGLVMSQAGVISGTPSTPGTYTFLVYASDSHNPGNSGQQTLTITIS